MKKILLKTWIPAAVTALFSLLFILLYLQPEQVNFWAQYSTLNISQFYFCEVAHLDRIMRQPANTFTNLPYLFFGTWMMVYGIRDRERKPKRNLLTNFPVYTFVYGFCSIMMFFGSSFFHISLLDEAEMLDLAGVYALVLFPLFYSLHKTLNLIQFKSTAISNRMNTIISVSMFFISWLLLSVFSLHIDHHVTVPVIILISAMLIFYLEWKIPGRTNRTWIFLFTITLLSGIGFFILDLSKIDCFHDYLLTPHAVWHLLAAVSIFSFYLYMRSEESMKQVDKLL